MNKPKVKLRYLHTHKDGTVCGRAYGRHGCVLYWYIKIGQVRP